MKQIIVKIILLIKNKVSETDQRVIEKIVT